ncbi:hypothetical protein [Patulibacter minatonensis]|uniref:hypothetical protein n=1 Tax=Patulibacter minatonensis TaxID=298163 RepID=UPI00047D221E|nr:hypothetical protein [Patulibacter minatonensis]
MSTTTITDHSCSPDERRAPWPALLQRTCGRVPITGEPVDGYLIAGALLLAVAATGLVTDLLGSALCGVVAVCAILLLRCSGRTATTR